MNSPIAKNSNRAYVRLHAYVTRQQEWDEFAKTYRIVLHSNGSEEVSQSVVRVLDKLGQPAALGPRIPHKITFSIRKVPTVSTWTECFNDGQSSWHNISGH
ncbi:MULTISPECIES: hypothetical protein [unclassified Comamonas]|uniref:hypothetical protein n=1 Tax=unclassified Comamonas TaxID=2638500 RepID=UPI001F098B17|nr:hypothetical protein [Comamonas sp. lk]